MFSRRLAAVLPILMAASVLPIVRTPTKPEIKQWALSVGESAPVEAPASFGLVGVSWPRSQDAPKRVEVRTSRDGKRWSGWSELEIERDVGPDRGTGEGGANVTTMPAWTGTNRFADVRFEGARPRGAKVHLIDPGRDPVTPLPVAGAIPAKPGIVTRAQWGADESMRRAAPDYDEPIRHAIVHHTATTDSYAQSESDNIVRSIYAYHVNTNGWNDIGYNFLVDRYGQIFEGRYGGVDRAVIGAHALGFNRNTTGVSVIGSFDHAKPPSATMSSLKRIISWKLDLDHVDPQAATTYTSGGSNKYPAGQKVALRNVTSHRDVGQTACPGQPLYDSLPWIRTAAALDGVPKLYSPRVTRSVITPNGDGVADGLSVTGRFSSTVSWKVEVLNYNGSVVKTVTGRGSSLSVPWYGKNSSGAALPHGHYRFRITGSNASGSFRGAYVGFDVWRWPNGTYFMPQPSGSSYILHRGVLRHPSTAQARATRYRSGEIVEVGDRVRSAYPVGSNIGFRDGSVVSVSGKLYLISDGARRPVSRTILNQMGFDPDSTIATTSEAVKPHPVGSTISSSTRYPDGASIRSTGGSEAWVINGVARPLPTENIRTSWLIRDVDLAGPADAAVAAGAMSDPIGFRDGSLVKVAGTTTVYVISGGRRMPISARSFSVMGYDSANIRTITPAELAVHEPGPSL